MLSFKRIITSVFFSDINFTSPVQLLLHIGQFKVKISFLFLSVKST